MDFDTVVKLNIYQTIAQTTKPPKSTEVAQALGASVDEVEAAFARLHAKRLLVPEPGDPSRIRMAPPFSGVATPFLVKIRDKSYYANCVWDALGIIAALHEDGVAAAADGHTGEAMALEVVNGQPLPQPCVIHFAVPAAKWWDDIIYT
ncbi:MAG TPA: organomercurial lyase [bacterium]